MCIDGRLQAGQPATGNRAAVTMVALCLGLRAVVELVGRIVSRWQVETISEDIGVESLEVVVSRLVLIHQATTVLMIGISGAMCVGLVRAGNASLPGRAKLLARLAAGGAGLLTALYLGILADSLVPNEPGMFAGTLWSYVMILGHAVTFGAMLGFFVLAARANGARVRLGVVAVAAGWITLTVAIYLYGVVTNPTNALFGIGPWSYILLTSAIEVAGYLALTMAAVAVAKCTPVAVGLREIDLSQSNDWTRAADGLALYRKALVWRIAVAVIGGLLVVVAISANSLGLAKFAASAMPFGAVLAGIGMVAGIAGFTRQPRESLGREAASFALVAMALGLLLDVIGLLLLFGILTAEPEHYSSLAEAARRVEKFQSLSTWAMIAGYTSLLALLMALARVSHCVDRADLARRTLLVGALLAMVAAVTVGYRLYLTAASPVIGTVVFGGVIALGCAVTGVAAYVSLTRAVEVALRSNVKLPRARMLTTD